MKATHACAQAHGLEGFTAVSPAYSLADYIHDPWGGSVAPSGKAHIRDNAAALDLELTDRECQWFLEGDNDEV